MTPEAFSHQASRLRAIREPESEAAAVRISGWGRWLVEDSDGTVVGVICEEREWLGDGYGPVSYLAARNPTGEDFGALWKGEGYPPVPTALAALAALEARLEG